MAPPTAPQAICQAFPGHPQGLETGRPCRDLARGPVQTGSHGGGATESRPLLDVYRAVNGEHFLSGTSRTSRLVCGQSPRTGATPRTPQLRFRLRRWRRGAEHCPPALSVVTCASSRSVDLLGVEKVRPFVRVGASIPCRITPENRLPCATFLRTTTASADFCGRRRRLPASPVARGRQVRRSPKVSCSSFTRATPDLPARASG